MASKTTGPADRQRMATVLVVVASVLSAASALVGGNPWMYAAAVGWALTAILLWRAARKRDARE